MRTYAIRWLAGSLACVAMGVVAWRLALSNRTGGDHASQMREGGAAAGGPISRESYRMDSRSGFFGTDDEALAALDADSRRGLDKIRSPERRVIWARSMAPYDQYDGDPSQIDRLLRYLEGVPVPSEGQFEERVVIQTTLRAIGTAWYRAGPYEHSVSLRIARAAVRFGAEASAVDGFYVYSILRAIEQDLPGLLDSVSGAKQCLARLGASPDVQFEMRRAEQYITSSGWTRLKQPPERK